MKIRAQLPNFEQRNRPPFGRWSAGKIAPDIIPIQTDKVEPRIRQSQTQSQIDKIKTTNTSTQGLQGYTSWRKRASGSAIYSLWERMLRQNRVRKTQRELTDEEKEKKRKKTAPRELRGAEG